MVNLNQLIDTVNGLRSDAYHLTDALTVDIRSLTQGVPLIGEKFYIQRVDGVLQLKKDSPYKISVLAVGVGPASQRHRSTVAISVNGRQLTDVSIDQIEANTATIAIPQSDLNPLFNDGKPVRVDAIFAFDVENKGITGWRTQHYSIPFGLTLMPINAGTITVVARVHSFDWVDTGQRDQKFQPTPNLDGADRRRCNEHTNCVQARWHDRTDLSADPLHRWPSPYSHGWDTIPNAVPDLRSTGNLSSLIV